MAVRGAYAIICQDGRAYVGGSKNIAARWRQHKHLLSQAAHKNNQLQSAWLELGSAAFSFVVLETAQVNEPIHNLEQKWIDKMRSVETGFNLSPTAGSCLGYRHTDQMRQKMSALQLGTKKSLPHRRNISESKKGEKNPSAKLTVKKVKMIRQQADAGMRHNEIAASFGVSRVAVSNIIRGLSWASA